jgi:predicted nucleic acid-binding protein
MKLLLPTALGLAASLLGLMPTYSQEPREGLRAKIEEWVETLRQIQKEEADWDVERQILQGSKDNLLTDIEQLEELIAEAKERKSNAETATVKRSERQAELDAASAAVGKALDGFEQQFIAISSYLPEPILNELGAELELMKNEEKRTKAGTTVRVKNLLASQIKVEKFNNKITETPLTIELPNGKKQQMDTVFFGLSIAYAINQSGDYALVGKPSIDGWKFSERNEYAEAIRRLVEVSRGEGEIEFVELPAKVTSPIPPE